MGQVNSQGLTWLEWRNAAGYADENFSGHDGGTLFSVLRDDWKSGVDPALHVAVQADYEAEMIESAATNRGRTENPETGRWE